MCYNGIFKMKKLLGNDIIKKSKIIKRVEKFTLCSKTQIPNFHNWIFFPSNCLINTYNIYMLYINLRCIEAKENKFHNIL